MTSAEEYIKRVDHIYKHQRILRDKFNVDSNDCLYDDMQFLQKVLCAHLIDIKDDVYKFPFGSIRTKELKAATITGTIGNLPLVFRRSIDEDSHDPYDSYSELLIGYTPTRLDIYNDIIDEWDYNYNRGSKWTDLFFQLTEEMINNPTILLAHSNNGIRSFAKVLLKERGEEINE